MSTAIKEIIDRDQDGLIYDGTKHERPVSKAAMMLALTRKRLATLDNDMVNGDALQASMEKRIDDLRAARKSIDQSAKNALKESGKDKLEGYELQVALRDEHEKLGLPAVEAEISQLSQSVRAWSSKRSSIQFGTLMLQEKLKLAELAAKPEFEGWFGDSVIRDYDGLPLVIYHGTVTGGFEEFSDVEGDRKTAIYGSTNLRIAAGYSGGYSDDVTPVFKSSIDDIDRDHLWRWYGNEEIGWEHGMRTSAEKAAKAAGVTSPVRTRYELTFDGFHSESPEVILQRYNGTLENRKIGDQGVYPLFFKMEKPLVVDGHGKFWDKLGHEYGNTTREVEVAAEKAGYDGVIFKNIRDNGYANSTTEAADVYAIFDPANIKSIHNVGTFDGSRSILKSMAKDGDGDGFIFDGTSQEQSVASMVESVESRIKPLVNKLFLDGKMKGSNSREIASRTLSSIFASADEKDHDRIAEKLEKVGFKKNETATAREISVGERKEAGSPHPNMLFHGTAVEFDDFDESKSQEGSHYGAGFYLSEDPLAAEMFSNLADQTRRLAAKDYSVGDEDPGVILRWKLKPDAKVKEIEDFPEDRARGRKLVDQARGEGFDAVRFEDGSIKNNEWSKIRSIGMYRRLGRDPKTTIVLNPKAVERWVGDEMPKSKTVVKAMAVRDGDGDGLIDDGKLTERPYASQPRDDRGIFIGSGAIRTAANDPAYADRLRASVTDPQHRRILDQKIAESVSLKDVRDFNVAQEPEVDAETPAYLLTFEEYVASETSKEIRRLQEATVKELTFWQEMKVKHENNELTEAEVKKIKGYTSFGNDPVERSEKINEQIEWVSNWKYINRIKLLQTGSANFEGEKYKEYKSIVQKAVGDGVEVPAKVLMAFVGADWIPKTTGKDIQVQLSSHSANVDFSRIGRSIESLKGRYEEGVAKAEEVRKAVLRLADSYTSKAEVLLAEMKDIKNVAIKAFDRYQVSEVPETKNTAYSEYQRLTNQYDEVQGQYQNISDVISRECRSVIKADGPTANIQIAWDSAVPQNLKEKWLPGVEWINGLVSASVVGDTVVQGKLLSAGENRAHYFDGLISLHENNDPKTVVHELGHAVEETAKIVDTSKAFIYIQSKNAAAKHLGDNYDYSEVYFEDKLVNNYSGKWYRDSTEVISTGLEHLFKDPVTFAKNAPDHFNYTVAFVKGWVSGAQSRNTSSLLKSGFDPMQPRDDDGRWVRREAIAAAAQDVETADSLRMRVTDPEQRKRLDMAIQTIREGGVDFDTKLRAQKEIKSKIKQIVEESPDSEAEVILGEDVDRVLDRMDWTPQDLASIVGAPDDSSVHVELINGSLEIHVYHEDIESCVRFLHSRSGRGISGYRASDKLYMENDVLKIKGASGKEERTAPKGFGTLIFASQVGNCARRGIAYITCLAGRNDDEGLVGYSVWPKLGYTGSITNLKPSVADKIRMNFPQAKTVLDVNSTPGGREWWAENGSSFEATFDLDEESPSMKTLAAYQNAKERVVANG